MATCRRPIGAVARCPRCRLQPQLCLCQALRPEPLGTRVVVLMHAKEVHKPTNTGRLLPLLLEGAEVRLRGRPGASFPTEDLLDSARRPLLLDPSGHLLDAAFVAADPRPITLVVPDGTWRQCRKTVTRELYRTGIPRVRLPAGAPSGYRIRNARREERLATIEAVARALGVIEGPAVQERLERAFDLLVERTLWARGALSGPPPGGGADPGAPAPVASPLASGRAGTNLAP